MSAPLEPSSTKPPASSVLPPGVTFFRRRLSDAVTHFNSPQGRKLFAEALSDGTMELYFPLSEQFTTQAEPAYCALSTLAMCMNAMSVDLGVVWRWPWRWAHEDTLCACLDRTPVRSDGVPLDVFHEVATCHGLSVETHYAADSSLEDFRALVASVSSEPTAVAQGMASDSVSVLGPEHAEPPAEIPAGQSYAFRKHNPNTSEAAGPRGGLRRCIAVAYSRKTLGQTGDGHVSPIGGYHAASDSVLIMDVARFKYPPYWVPLSLLWESMLPQDKATGMSRGWAVLALNPGEQPTLEHQEEDDVEEATEL